MTTSFFGRRQLLAAAIALCAFPAAQAQGDWPRGQTIRMVVPFTAGSSWRRPKKDVVMDLSPLEWSVSRKDERRDGLSQARRWP